MWVLILSLISPMTSAATSIGVVNGFKSLAACQNAGNAWIAEAKKAGSYPVPVAVCAKQD